MNNLILPLLLCILFFFHRSVRRFTAGGKVKEGFCALWLIDTIFVACGTMLSFVLYEYSLTFWLSWQSPIFIALYLLVTVFFILITPSGFQVFRRPGHTSPEELLCAEYRFNDTLGLVRNFFMILLFVLPMALQLTALKPDLLSGFLPWTKDQICGAVCFVIFLILLPLCLRQAMFWLKNLQCSPTEAETTLLRNYRTRLYYKRKNRHL